ncbi:MAG: threonine synthase [Pseudomonadota bacterium]
MTDTFVSHLECSLTGKRYEAGRPHGLSEAGRPLLVRYDLERMKATLDRDAMPKEGMADGPAGFWRYASFLPVEKPENRVSLGEVMTPIMPLTHSAASIGAKPGKVLVKDEGRLPTGSFKARGLCLAVSMAKSFGITHMAIPTNGNAGAALAAYGRKADMKITVLCPEDTPDINIREIQAQGANTYTVNGLINDCGKLVGAGKESIGWFDVSTLKEPYRIEGKKTMGLELAEQLGWKLPDIIFYPTGGGTGLIGMWKAFAELKALGWLEGPMPRMVAVQATGCAPIVKAWEEGEEHAPLWEGAHTVAAGIRVPIAVGDFLIIRAVRESGGFAMALPDDEIMAVRDRIAAEEGMLLCPEGAATAAAYARARAEGKVSADETAVLWNCATGLKYPLPPVIKRLDKGATVTPDLFA